MTAGSLYPAYFDVVYTSDYGSHRMTLPVREWSPGGGTNDSGTILAWDESDRDAEAMLVELLEVIATQFPVTVAFNSYTIYTKDSPTAPSQPVFSHLITPAVAGTDETPGWTKAVQNTWTIRCDDFSIFKLVLLDSSSNDEFDPFLEADNPGVSDVMDVLNAVTNGWQSRQNGRPQTFLQISTTLNEKLRRAYRMF